VQGGPVPAALTYDPTNLLAYDLRPKLLGLLADLPGGQGIVGEPSAALAALLRWLLPMSISKDLDIGPLVAGVWREAQLLGLVAPGTRRDDGSFASSLTPLGWALCRDPEATPAGPITPEDHGETLERVAEELLPAAVQTAMFQADLTAVVPGVPAANLAALLDAAADLESRGGATTWRFTQASVRRALDAGRDAPGLLTELRAVAVGGVLPQPLEYLLGDVARRHGAIRVRPVTCVLHATDPALLAEVASARALAPLGLSLLAPTVLASAKPAEDTLSALRAAGYAPVGEAADGSAQIERAAPQRAPDRRRTQSRSVRGGRIQTSATGTGPAADPHAFATALLFAPVQTTVLGQRPRGQAANPDQLELALPDWDPDEIDENDPMDDLDGLGVAAKIIVQFAPQLSQQEQVMLLASIDDGAPVKISYTNTQGQSSVRVVEPLGLDRNRLAAWCYLRDEERMFTLDRIYAVAPA
jgi:hypothetical protein